MLCTLLYCQALAGLIKCVNFVMQEQTPLHLGAMSGRLDVVEALLGTPDGALVDARDSEACVTAA